jgi:hypothetical protein
LGFVLEGALTAVFRLAGEWKGSFLPDAGAAESEKARPVQPRFSCL